MRDNKKRSLWFNIQEQQYVLDLDIKTSSIYAT